MKVLLVEDSPAEIELIQYGLRSSTVCTGLAVVSTGDEAVAYIRRDSPHQLAPSPDLVLLDISLPGMTGLEVLREIQTDGHLEHIRVIVHTTSNSGRDVVSAYELYAHAYMTKPFDAARFDEVTKGLRPDWYSVVRHPKSG